ncbi:MAG: cysteine desulfurase NifS [bacterium]
MKTIYLDNNATTRVADEAKKEMEPFFCEFYGNPSSMHTFGGGVQKHIDNARERLASLLGAADPAEIIFTSCGSESDNAAIWAALRTCPEKKHVVTSRVEHPAVLNLCHFLESQGYKVTYLGVDGEGRLDMDHLREAVNENTAIVTLMWANNDTGVVFPVEDAARIVKSRGSVFHTDAVQSAGKIPINLKNSAIDMLSVSGHKLHAPKGIGALYVRKGTRFIPFLMGGHQERGRRAGTENVPYIVGFGKAAELAGQHIEKENTKVKTLRDRLELGLMKAIPNCRRNGHPDERLPNTANISFEFVEGEAILLLLSEKGIAASSGSACTSGALEPSHVLRAMGVPYTFAHGSVRFSLSRYTTAEEIDTLLREMPGIIEKLRKISPFSEGKPLFGQECEIH